MAIDMTARSMRIERELRPMVHMDDEEATKYLLLRSGASLLLVSMLIGLATGVAPIRDLFIQNPRLALGAHIVGGAYSLILMVLGVMWPSLAFDAQWSRLTAWILIAGFWLSILVAMVAATVGVVPGDPIYPMAGGLNKHETHNAVVIALIYAGVSATAVLELAGTALVMFVGLRLGRGWRH